MNFQFRASLKYTQTRDITSSGKYFMHGQDDNILWISYIMRCRRIFAGTLGLYLNYSGNLGLGLNELCTVIRIYTLRFLGIYTNRNSELNYIFFLERKRSFIFTEYQCNNLLVPFILQDKFGGLGTFDGFDTFGCLLKNGHVQAFK